MLRPILLAILVSGCEDPYQPPRPISEGPGCHYVKANGLRTCPPQ